VELRYLLRYVCSSFHIAGPEKPWRREFASPCSFWH
jgi:hypothetical protein